MEILIVAFISIVALLSACFALYSNWRLSKYIQNNIEEEFDELKENQLNLLNSFKIALKEDLLDENNRIRKPIIQN